MANEDQSRIVAFMCDAAHWPDGTRRVRHVETHISHVFVGRRLAFKMKKAVRLPYVDFSTLDRRHDMCLRELRINARFSPRLYLGVDAVTEEADGALALAGTGRPVEWLVRMRSFPERAILARHVAEKGIDDALVRALARMAAAGHRVAEIRHPPSGAAILRATLERQIAGSFTAHETVLAHRGGALVSRLHALIDAHGPLLDARAREGWVRRCHGDMHMGNIVLIDGKPTLFDAIEFDDALATVDVLHDLAFLLMDLAHVGHRAAACGVFNGWLAVMDAPAHYDAVGAIGLMTAIRAAIRCMVALDLADQKPPDERESLHDRARAYLKTAEGAARTPRPRLVVVAGPSGSGKTTLARALAPLLAPGPGAVHLRSDVERKIMCGRDELDRLPEDCYRPEVSARVYARLMDRAERALRCGWPVVLDAVFLKPEERAAARAIADRAGVPFIGLWLTADADVLMRRVRARTGDASDATAEIVRRQLEWLAEEPGDGWRIIDASGAPDEIFATASAHLGLRDQPS